MKFLPVCLLMSLSGAFAAEPVELPLDVGTLKMRDGKVYEGAKIVGKDAVGVKVMHAGGTARIPYARLPKDLADRFPRDHGAAKEQLEKESRAEAAHDRTVDKALAKQAGQEEKEAEERVSALESMPDAKGDNTAKILALEAYVMRLESGIADAEMKAANARDKAAAYRRASVGSLRQDAYGNVYSDPYASSKERKARFHDRRAEREIGRISEARSMIAAAQQRIQSLRGREE